MAISNGYATLAEIKRRMLDAHTYTATTIAFVNATSKITDSAKGLKRFQTGDLITVSGTDDNDGAFTVATGDVAAEIVTTEALTDEAVGDTVIITDVSDPIDDGVLENVVTAISRVIDDYTGRRFYRNSADETRYYTAEFSDTLECPDDIGSITTLATDSAGNLTWSRTWASGDYVLWPFNAVLDSQPYTEIRLHPTGGYTFPTAIKGVKIVGKFGYSTTAPARINEACLLISEQLFTRKDAIFGTIGSPSGERLMAMAKDVLQSDPHIKLLLAYFARMGVGSI